MIELTQVMINRFEEDCARTASIDAGLKAVLALIDPVPDTVRMISDRGGDDYYRLAEGGNVWRHECGCCCSTFAWLQETVGPMTWGTNDEH